MKATDFKKVIGRIGYEETRNHNQPTWLSNSSRQPQTRQHSKDFRNNFFGKYKIIIFIR